MASFSAAEIAELAIGHLSTKEVERAVTAFNGFSQIFGSEWITQFFRGTQAPGFVSYIRSLWEDWIVVRHLPHSEQLARRWALGIREAGVEAEVKVIAYHKRENVKLELFPEIESCKVPECRFRAADTWVYAEVPKGNLRNPPAG